MGQQKTTIGYTLLLLAVGAGIMLPGLGRQGLWDPWEMRSAHVARAVAEPARVLVAEAPSFAGSSAAWPLSGALAAAVGSSAVVVPPDGFMPASTTPATGTQVRSQAATALRQQVYHGAALDARLWAKDLSDTDGLSELAQELNNLGTANGGTALALVWPELSESAERVAEALWTARVRLARDELDPKVGGLPALDEASLAALYAELGQSPEFAGPQITLLIGQSAESLNFSDWVASLPSPWLRVQFKRDGVSRALPPLPIWLAAASYKSIGFSELASRLPFALLALLGALLTFFAFRGLVGQLPALLAALALLTSPLYVGLGRFAVSEIATTVGLTAFAASLGHWLRASESAQSPKSRAFAALAAVGASLVWLLLADGLFGLLAPLLLAAGVPLVLGETRLRHWAPAAIAAGVLGLVALWVFSGHEWNVGQHLRFTRRLFTEGLPESTRSFDFMLKQIGFGLMPWSALLPLALGALVLGLRERAAAQPIPLLILLWSGITLALYMVAAPQFNHFVFPAAPGIALAIGIFVAPNGEGAKLDRVAAFIVFCLLYVLLREVREYPDSPFVFLATDPPFDKTQGAALAFPSEHQTSSAFRYMGYAALAALLAQYARLPSLVFVWTRRLTSPGALWALSSLFLLALSARWLYGFAEALSELGGDDTSAQATIKAFAARALTRPEQIALAATTGVFGLQTLLTSTAWGRKIISSPPRWIGWPASLLGRGLRALRLHEWTVPALASAILGATILATALIRLPGQAGGGLAQAATDPGLWLLAIAAASAPWLLRRFAPSPQMPHSEAPGDEAPSSGSLSSGPPKPAPRWAPSVLFAGLALAYLGARLSKAQWITLTEQWALIPLLALAVAPLWLYRSPPVRAFRVLAAWFTWIAYVAGALAPMVGRWLEGSHTATSDPIRTLLLGSRVALLVYAGLAIVAGVALGHFLVGRSGANPLRLAALRARVWRAARALEQPRWSASLLSIAAIAMAGLYAQSLMASMSYHVSQKHILDTYRAAAPNTQDFPLFSHGQFAGADEDYNFYTNNVPRIVERDPALRLLSRTADQIYAPRIGGSVAAARVLAGWNPANDTNGDAKRDFPAIAGVARSFAGGVLSDPSQAWTPNQWKGAVLVDGQGATFPITANDATTATVSGTPALAPAPGGGLRYTLDHPGAADHNATAAERARSFFVLPKRQFSELNHAYRKLVDGAHIPIIDDRSSRMMLAASWLAEGETSQNPIDAVTHTQEEFEAIEGVKRVQANFEGKLEIVGYRLDEEVVRKRSKFVLHTYFKVLQPLSKSYKIFLHVDKQGSSHRIHGDHFVLNEAPKGEDDEKCVGCYQTTHWLPGDIIEDIYTREVPTGAPSGGHNMWIGLFEESGGSRLKVQSFDKATVKHDGENRINLGVLRVQ